MRLVARILTSILGLVWLAVTLAAMVLLLAIIRGYNWFEDAWLALVESNSLCWYVLVSLGIFSFLHLWLLSQVWRRERMDAIMHTTDLGSIHISLDTVRAVALKAGSKIRGVRELYVSIKHIYKGESTVLIGLKAIADGERPVQELTEELQRVIKARVEAICGIKVAQVMVYYIIRVERQDRRSVRH